MNKKLKFTTIGILGFIICIAFADVSVYAKSENNRNDTYSIVQFNGKVSSIDPNARIMVVNKVTVYVVSNLNLNKGAPITTELIGDYRKSIPLTDFKNNQEVIVSGYRTNDGNVIAFKIQVMGLNR